MGMASDCRDGRHCQSERQVRNGIGALCSTSYSQIWDMSTPSHTPQAVHTLHIGRASHFVRWSTDATKPCDVIVAPSPVGSSVGTLDDSWRPDVEIWDVRREYLPKHTFWLGGSPVCAYRLLPPREIFRLRFYCYCIFSRPQPCKQP